MEQKLQSLNEFEKDSEWFHKNIDILRAQNLTGKFVAVFEGKPIASDKDLNVVITFIEKKGLNPAYVFIEFVYPEGTIVLL